MGGQLPLSCTGGSFRWVRLAESAPFPTDHKDSVLSLLHARLCGPRLIPTNLQPTTRHSDFLRPFSSSVTSPAGLLVINLFLAPSTKGTYAETIMSAALSASA
jgi:hypothetical protein